MYQRTSVIITSLLISYCFSAAQLAGQARPAAQTRPPAVQPAGGPLSVAEIIEGLYSLRSVKNVEDLVAARGVKFQATPEVVAILREFGATDIIVNMIPLPPPPPAPPKPAGALTVACEPVDCLVIVGDNFYGPTQRLQKVITGLLPGAPTVQVISDGYERQTRQIELREDRPVETRFTLMATSQVREQMGTQSLMGTLRVLGGIEGMTILLGELEGDGVLDWTDSAGQLQRWPLEFTKRPGKDLKMEFKPRGGGCSVTIFGETTTTKCDGNLRNYAEVVAEEATEFFLTYQIQDVLQQLLDRTPPVSVGENPQRLESSNGADSYVLNIDKDRMPADLVHATAARPDIAIQVSYSKYMNLGKGRYPMQFSVGLVNKGPQRTFTLINLRSRLVR